MWIVRLALRRQRDFSPTFELMLKDANLIKKFAENLRSPVQALLVAEKNLKSSVALGFGQENASALIKALEKEAVVEEKAHHTRRSTETERND